MEYRRLGRTDVTVSSLCLGTMTFGQQNSEDEAFALLDRAVAAGINFLDTAEMYPIPAQRRTYGATETIIGNWLQARGGRAQVILATKVVGRSDWLPHIRGGRACLDRKNIEAALNGSLKRLKTDYIDLYQLHWPDRRTNFFGRLGYQPEADDDATPLQATLSVLADLVRSGKVRYVGISNETPWGLMRYLQLSEQSDLPRMVSIQNPYSLLNRTFDVGLAEISCREQVGLLPYSPLGFGVLTGKYLDNRPPEARLTLFPEYSRYTNPAGVETTRAHVELARTHGLSPAQMALAYVTSRPFVCSTIIGATTHEQLDENLGSAALTLSDEVLGGIEAIHARHPNPCP
jgi:aryl-alcohol dehydrogenase-like predicted oxidoreductase